MTDHTPDHVTETEMAVIYHTTKKALEGRRHKGQIPKGVWFYAFGKVHYSIKGYEAWLESQRECQRASSSSGSPSESASRAPAGAAAKPSPTRKRQRGSQPPQVYALR